MTKKEMEALLMEKYGYDKKDLRDDKGNPFVNKVLEEMIASEEAKQAGTSEDKKEDLKQEDDIFTVDETVFEAHHNLKDTDLVLCMSGVSGEMNFSSPLTNFRITARKFGQAIKIPYQDLVYVHNIAPEAFEEGVIVVLNEKVQEEFGLKDTYKSILTPKNVRAVISMDADDLRHFMQDMPKSAKSTLYDEARELYKQDKIDSMKTIKVFEDEFGVSFDDNAPIKIETK